jgi:hypothetical protein
LFRRSWRSCLLSSWKGWITLDSKVLFRPDSGLFNAFPLLWRTRSFRSAERSSKTQLRAYPVLTEQMKCSSEHRSEFVKERSATVRGSDTQPCLIPHSCRGRERSFFPGGGETAETPPEVFQQPAGGRHILHRPQRGAARARRSSAFSTSRQPVSTQRRLPGTRIPLPVERYYDSGHAPRSFSLSA